MDITGASGAIPKNDTKRRDAHAERYYDEIRKRSSDIDEIARNTGLPRDDVEKIKNHLFNNEYDLGGPEPQTFDSDYNIAVSWQRLIDGKGIQEMDNVLLDHELLENELMNEQNMPYAEAHKIAHQKHNYMHFTD